MTALVMRARLEAALVLAREAEETHIDENRAALLQGVRELLRPLLADGVREASQDGKRGREINVDTFTPTGGQESQAVAHDLYRLARGVPVNLQWRQRVRSQHRAEAERVLAEVDAEAERAIRDRIAQALAKEDAQNAGHDHGFLSYYGADKETDGFVDAVLAALPESADGGISR